MKTYHIQPLIWAVQDAKSVKFHVANDDYFGTMATVLNLWEQHLQKNGVFNAAFKRALKNLKRDLLFLQKNYQIKPKIKKKNRTPKGRLKSQ